MLGVHCSRRDHSLCSLQEQNVLQCFQQRTQEGGLSGGYDQRGPALRGHQLCTRRKSQKAPIHQGLPRAGATLPSTLKESNCWGWWQPVDRRKAAEAEEAGKNSVGVGALEACFPTPAPSRSASPSFLPPSPSPPPLISLQLPGD